jgi:anthranilate synthase/aminodeoxychorismate synthase-like glutamine amidotransferase
MILVIDNYDSFVHNLARYFEREGQAVRVVRNDAITVNDVRALDPLAIVLSPGPCSPNEAGICLEIVRELGAEYPILGVCLGHQAIGQAYGGMTLRAARPVHGKASVITHDGTGIFAGVKSPINVARYHSLIADITGAPDLKTMAVTGEGEIMAIAHKTHPVYGVQYHPESILTEQGDVIVRNFIEISQNFRASKQVKAA